MLTGLAILGDTSSKPPVVESIMRTAQSACEVPVISDHILNKVTMTGASITVQ
jgi:hypothetical protein